jgi:hypothetical protein
MCILALTQLKIIARMRERSSADHFFDKSTEFEKVVEIIEAQKNK